MEKDDAPGLSSMPQLVLTHIGKYLSPRLLYDVSTMCLDLRTAFNTNSIWRTHSQGGLVGRMLEHATSIVEPVFSVPSLDTLDPLCEHRLHFIRQSRLLHNLRHGEYVHHVIPRPEDVFYHHQGQIMYKSDYLFVAVVLYSPTRCTFIFVYDIREEPQLVTTFRAGTDEHSQHISRDYDVDCVTINVAGDRLVILHDRGFQVREINLPSATFPLLFSWWEADKTINGRYMCLDNFVIQVTRKGSYITNVWNIDTEEKINIKSPEDGQHLSLMHLSTGEGLILLSSRAKDSLTLGWKIVHGPPPRPLDSGNDAYVYNLHTQQYTFHVHHDDSHVTCGRVGSNHVILYAPSYYDSNDWYFTVSVYDYQMSTLIVQKALLEFEVSTVDIIKDCLVTSDPESVKVFNLSGLDLLYELPYTTECSPVIGEHIVRVSRGLCCDLLFIDEEVWDFNDRRKLFTLEHSENVTVNESSSKIISMNTLSTYSNLHIHSFW